MEINKKKEFTNELSQLLNKYSIENESNTPDFLLAEFLVTALDNMSIEINTRDKAMGVDMWARKKVESEYKYEYGVVNYGMSVLIDKRYKWYGFDPNTMEFEKLEE